MKNVRNNERILKSVSLIGTAKLLVRLGQIGSLCFSRQNLL